MRLSSLSAGILIALTSGSVANSADMDNLDSGSLPWSGFFIGAFGGYHAGDIINSDCTGICPANPEFNIWGVGIQAGYDHEFANRIVLGGYAMLPLAVSKDSFTLPIFGAYNYKTTLSGFIGARLGYDMQNGFLPYVAGGYNFARVEATNGTYSQTNTHHGYHLSFGAEYLVTDNISADLRYTYSEFGKEVYNPGVASTWGEKASAVTLGINYRF